MSLSVHCLFIVQREPDDDLWQEFLVDYACLDFAFEEGEENLAELVHLYQCLLIFDHLIQLLLQIVENPVVHHIAVDFAKHIILLV